MAATTAPAKGTFLDRLRDDPVGKAIVGVVIGLGLASLFRQTCKDGTCVVIRGPSRAEVDNHVYKIDEQCYKYVPISTSCSATTMALRS